ncbi:MAG TPA: PAS domain S-box protein, partial [Pyrinomonadaceae bacterium]|nr:PAS domain S-box protein [Pyrinomonadaceae bacterium]
FSLSNFSIARRLPILIGLLLIAIIFGSTWASYLGVKESALEVGRERLLNLTQQLANQSQQSLPIVLGRTFAAANDPAVHAFLRSPSSATRPGALSILRQFSPTQDPNSLQVELWNTDRTVALIEPENASPEPADLTTEFRQCATDPFKVVGPIRVVNNIVVYTAVAGVKDDTGKVVAYLVRWRRASPTANVRKQLADLLGSQAAVYYGNSQGDVWTDLEKAVPKPPVNLGATLEVTHYPRDGNSVMALGRPIGGTPWFLIVEFPVQPLLAHSNQFLRRMLLIDFGLLVTGLVATIALSRNITRPLRSLTEAASIVSGGDYSHLVDIRQHDELGELASAFNGMVVKVRDTQRELERKVQERTLQLEAAPNAMLMVDKSGRITLANSQTEQLFGYDRSELLQQPIEMLVPERYRGAHPGHRQIFSGRPTARAMGAGRDLFGLRKDGSEVPIEIGLSPIQTETGSFVLASIIDITERKQAEEKLRRSQEQLAGVIGSAMDAIITVDDEQRIVLFNGAAERMFLFPSEDAIGQPLDRFIPERFRAAHKDHIQDFGKTHVTKRSMGLLGPLFGLRADGQEFPIEASISQIESDGRRLYTVILRDVTERKRADEALKEQARILDLAPVMIRDLNDRILFWNTGVEEMFGWKAEEALEKISHNLLKTEFPRPLEEIKARLYADGHWEGETIHTRKDGKQIVIASQWVLRRDEQDKPKAILVVNNDITERKQAEEEIRRLNEELEQRVAERTAELQAVNKELEAFSYSVSHDLRAPLRHINGFSQALLEDCEDKLDDSGKGYLNQVREASHEMAQLIDDVLQLARVTRTEMRREPVNLSELAASVVAELPERETRRKAAVDIETGLSARGDKRLLRIVLTNLMGNAWKFTSRRTEAQITFGREQQNGENTYFIRDNGAGFDMAYANKLFGAFQRLHTTGEFEGTGIGLATVQRIVHRHGGRVWAEGKVDQGATFFFTLPTSKEIGDGQQSDLTG